MKKQKKYEIISETDKVVTFKYDGAECSYAKACYYSIDEVIKEIDEERVREKEVDKRIASQRDTMTPEERERQDEADRVVFERWQDEANTNLYLTGVVDEDEDPDFNPFRKNND